MRAALYILLLLISNAVQAQYYKVFFNDVNTVPEFTTEGTVLITNQNTDGLNIPIPKRCTIDAANGAMKGRYLSLDKRQLQANKGKVKFFISCDGVTDTITEQFCYLRSIRFNLYTDSIKPVMNYYINVEGEFSTGRILPLSSDMIEITASEGTMSGMEWTAPDNIDFDFVEFTAVCPYDPSLAINTTVYLKKVFGD